MMNRATILIGAIAITVSLLSFPSFADPIKDVSLNAYKAGWYPNVVRGRAMSCAQACKLRTGGLAEYEASAIPPTRRAFVCKVQGRPKNQIRTWLYGSQFDARAACYTVGLNLKGKYSGKFFCLCVARGSRPGTRPKFKLR